jgi:hypothetical protein
MTHSTNAAAIAARACEERRKRDQAADALTESVASIIKYGGGDKDAALAETFAQYRKFMAKSFAATAAGDEADLDDEETEVEDDDETGSNDHHASKVADMLVEAGSHSDRASALAWLMHHKDGQALLDRMKKGDTMKKDNWQSIAKDYGVIAVAKLINADNDAHGITEAELVDLIGKHDPKAGESAAQTFARNYEANIELRKAVQLTKAFPNMAVVTPRVVGGADAFPSTARSDGSSPSHAEGNLDATPALEELNRLVEEQRKLAPFKSTAQLFAAVYSDPANRDLVKRERAENRPTGHPSFPAR